MRDGINGRPQFAAGWAVGIPGSWNEVGRSAVVALAIGNIVKLRRIGGREFLHDITIGICQGEVVSVFGEKEVHCTGLIGSEENEETFRVNL